MADHAALRARTFQTLHHATIFPETLSDVLIPAIVISIPSIFSDIWDSVLRAVPKKKTSHMKKRHRQLAGKALKDVTALNTCSGCGRAKRAHILCPYCVASELPFPDWITLLIPAGVRRWLSSDLKPDTTGRTRDALSDADRGTKSAATKTTQNESNK